MAEVWPTCGIAAMPGKRVSACVNADLEALIVECFLQHIDIYAEFQKLS